jgi:hypothetical protein
MNYIIGQAEAEKVNMTITGGLCYKSVAYLEINFGWEGVFWKIS